MAYSKTYNPCDDCQYNFSKNGQESNMCKICEFKQLLDKKVKHGYWKPSPDGINPIRCSECNMPAPFACGENEFGDFVIERYPSSYCHECGAIMDGGKTE